MFFRRAALGYNRRGYVNLTRHLLAMQHTVSTRPPCHLSSSSWTSDAELTFGSGHYRALLWDEGANAWRIDEAMGIHVNVEASTCELACIDPARKPLVAADSLISSVIGALQWTYCGEYPRAC